MKYHICLRILELRDFHSAGAKGFEEFSDVVKHVCNENGISRDDKRNLHEMIRIPGREDFLKTFRCLFCPGEGMKFVGMKEDCFLDHIRHQVCNLCLG